MGPGIGTRRKNRAIDPTSGRNTPASKEPEPVSSFAADGRQPLLPQEYLTIPVL